MHYFDANKRKPAVRPLAAALIAGWLVIIGGARAALAHNAPSVLHDYVISMTPDTLTLNSYVRVSPELVPDVYNQIDTDRDGQTSESERQAWVAEHPSKLKVALDGKEMRLTMGAAPPLGKEDFLVSIDTPVKVTYTARIDPPAFEGKHRVQVTYGDSYLAYDEYYISVARDQVNDGKPHNVARPSYPATYQIIYFLPPAEERNQLPQGELAPAPYTAPQPQPQPSATETQSGNIEPAPAFGGIGFLGTLSTTVQEALRSWRGELWSALGMLLVAAGLGALHALTPGHGKTLVAAYLVGSKGRVRDAVVLGGVVTFAHTAVVIVLGLLIAPVSNASLMRTLQPALEAVAGLLVVAIGAYLLATRWRALSSSQEQKHAHLYVVEPAEAPAVQPVAATAGGGGSTPSGAPTRRLIALPARAEVHSHDDHDHPHNHAHGHGHDHVHEVPSGPVDAHTLIGLGISGGVVPCPEALVILLLAVTVGQAALGLGLVVSFSLGLAAVLIFIGIALVKMRGLLDPRFASNPLWTRWVPLLSAAIVTVIGLLMLVASLSTPWA